MRWLSLIGGKIGLAAIGGVILGGVVAVPVADYTDQYFSDNAFCADSCHVMTATVAEELKKSPHRQSPSGVDPSCADCHVSHNLTHAMWDHLLGTKELYATVVLGIDTVEEFEAIREEAADRVRMRMVANDSKNCRGCHVMEAIKPERKRGQKQHKEALEQGMTCILCHYNIAHKEVEPSAAFENIIASY